MIKELNKEELKLVRGGLDVEPGPGEVDRIVIVPQNAFDVLGADGPTRADIPVTFRLRIDI